ncbi:splicing factor 3B subunit 4-like [Bombina bombina]|uniref:splicing factor 3B subunit 4-like n=1 Tax=Bombina bombina TaxID=8345 RepID=UPI00235A5B7B|nr:splicing factor 3B subunit 4-like [Bombina bombina]XP_053557549.1 splicing factor 3B subunit 4-like [Bombina bombina]
MEPPVTRLQTGMPPPPPPTVTGMQPPPPPVTAMQPPPPPVFRQQHEQYPPRHEQGWIASVEDPEVMPPPLAYDPWQDTWPDEYPGLRGSQVSYEGSMSLPPPQHNIRPVMLFHTGDVARNANWTD